MVWCFFFSRKGNFSLEVNLNFGFQLALIFFLFLRFLSQRKRVEGLRRKMSLARFCVDLLSNPFWYFPSFCTWSNVLPNLAFEWRYCHLQRKKFYEISKVNFFKYNRQACAHCNEIVSAKCFTIECRKTTPKGFDQSQRTESQKPHQIPFRSAWKRTRVSFGLSLLGSDWLGTRRRSQLKGIHGPSFMLNWPFRKIPQHSLFVPPNFA